MAAVLSFLTYSLAGNDLDTAKVFASLQLFNVVRTPIQGFPKAISNLTDAHVAVVRLAKFLTAEDRSDQPNIDPMQDCAVEVCGSFMYEEQNTPLEQDNKVGKTSGERGKVNNNLEAHKLEPNLLPCVNIERTQHSVCPAFSLQNISLSVPRGSLTLVMGRVGSGKTSLLQALVGEMRRASGRVSFSGTTSLVTQTSWIQNASLKDNILFGKELDAARLNQVVQACALEEDVDSLPDGIETEIGGMKIKERSMSHSCISNIRSQNVASISVGVNDLGSLWPVRHTSMPTLHLWTIRSVLSTVMVIFIFHRLTNPLVLICPSVSVSSHLLSRCLLGLMSNKTRILVTHNLDVAPYADNILVMDEGRIAQQGSFQ